MVIASADSSDREPAKKPGAAAVVLEGVVAQSGEI
jgi:hypothetical protein